MLKTVQEKLILESFQHIVVNPARVSHILSGDDVAIFIRYVIKNFCYRKSCDIYVREENGKAIKVLEIIMKMLKIT